MLFAGPEFIVFAGCDAHLLWQTSLACPPSNLDASENAVCKTPDLNLPSLAMLGRNYDVPVTASASSPQKMEILYNVCSRLAHGKGKSRCGYDSAACLVVEHPETGLATYVGLGRADVDSAQLRRLANGSSLLVYGRGDPCTDDKSSVPHHSLSTLFICDSSVKVRPSWPPFSSSSSADRMDNVTTKSILFD
jgi:hypothetical protein